METVSVCHPQPLVDTKQSDMAPKISSIKDKKIAFLDNLKPQSDQVLKGIRGIFESKNVEMFQKIDTPTPVPEDVVETIRKNYHGMVTGVGD